MKVTCSRCGTEYNFDDAKVTEDGVKVKCTRCENVFRVRKKAFVLTEPVQPGGAVAVPDSPSDLVRAALSPESGVVPPAPPPEVSQTTPNSALSQAPGRLWSIRKEDGENLEFTEMTTLQRWIVERRVGRGDEISHNGIKWKKLGTIAELGPFFAVVDATITNKNLVAVPAPAPEATRIQDPAEKSRMAVSDAVRAVKPAPPAKAARGGAGLLTVSLLGILLLVGAVGWAQLTDYGRRASEPARDWLLAQTGLDLRLVTPTPVVVHTPTPTPVAPVSPAVTPPPSATPTAVAVASPSPAPTKTGPKHAASTEQLLQQGYELYSRGRYREAIGKYQSALNASPDDSEAYALLGLAYLDSGQDDLAESSLEASIRINPRFADAHRYLGMLFAKRGDKEQALAEFNAYLDQRPDGPTSDDVRRRVASLGGG